MTDTITIPIADGGTITLRPIEGSYDYKTHGATCPICGGVGFPWGGWFSCDNGPSIGSHIAVIADGRCFEVVTYG